MIDDEDDSPFAEWVINDDHVRQALAEGQSTREWIWVTRERRHVAIKDMDDNHLLNTIRVLRGRSPRGTRFVTDSVRRRAWINAMANEAYQRGLTIEAQDEQDPAFHE